ncbi:hypothetical protein FQN51_002142 [Onygenales sp. PD_10]|nr:hypothetical protein FQN51_002142 [Onygenales sp. PD_10]
MKDTPSPSPRNGCLGVGCSSCADGYAANQQRVYWLDARDGAADDPDAATMQREKLELGRAEAEMSDVNRCFGDVEVIAGRANHSSRLCTAQQYVN